MCIILHNKEIHTGTRLSLVITGNRQKVKAGSKRRGGSGNNPGQNLRTAFRNMPEN